MAEDYIWIVTDSMPVEIQRGDTPRSPTGEDVVRSPKIASRPGIPIPANKLEQGMAEFLNTMGRVLKHAQERAQDMGGMELEEVELSVEVNAEGQLSLLGSGASLGGSSAITLRFRKVSNAS
ncbi:MULTISPECIES: hypothetical protein [unclassified Leptolyngbya]|uniref:Pepco domain-containing protein n=1 Tax=unclassified Leptolyngbya TaxID=2650499 RepID=UPI001689FFC9|nr:MULTISPECIES: hypothetical protein [unclassified Leptolyngbya]MBD1911853.1 hypothetical protein [Leptolyngbya sp. FACHB-8]MBD2156062.1 hypothetical protein [Leptolyngbya sp. FACHB-16]